MFDIDKLGLSMLNIDKSGKSDFAEGSEKYYQNQLIKDYITLLIDPKSQHILHRPIDNDTKLLKDVLAEIEKSSGTQEMPYGFYSLSTQTERKDDYITGKIGIGPFALNNNNHILTMLYGVKFKDFDDSIMSVLGLTDLSSNRDQDGESIMSWLSALINAHVDIAKDPYISRLNVGPFTYNLVNTLIRTGFGKKTFYLTTLPIMKELASAYNRASSLYMQDSNKSKWKLQQEAVEEAAKKRFENVKIGDWTFDELVEGLSNLEDVKYKPTINKYIKELFESDVFKNNANKDYNECKGATIHIGNEDDFSEGAFLNLNAEQVQLLTYLAYILMDPYARSVSNLVKFSKIDTKKHGKSYIEQLVFWRGFNDLFYNPNGTGLFDETSLRRMANESYIQLKTDNAISMTKAILKDQFLQSSNAFDNAIPVVLKMIGKPESKSADLWTSIANTLSAAVKSEFINNYAKKLPQYSSTYMRDLISESEDDLEFTQEANSNRLKVVGNPKYDLKSYIGGAVTMKFVQDGENREHTFNIIGYDDQTNELIVDYKFKREHTGSIHIAGGKNTIYDRFMNLYLDLKDDPVYRDMLDIAGEPVNYLLKSLTVGKTFTYTKPSELAHITKHEAPDTYPTAKFVKLFNALDQNGPEANYIIDAWDQLLHDEAHPKLKRFAEDLVIYSFITSGDQGGFTKFFKQVPLSWRIESGYADHIYDKLQEFKTQELSAELIEDAILNNWFDNQFVPTYQLATDGKSNFITYYNNSPSTGIARANYPTIAAALRQENSGSLTPTIETENAPLFMKIPRRREKLARDSQRRYTVFRRISYGMLKSLTPIVEKDNQDRIHVKEQWIHYPIYVKVEPKGNLLTLNYLITEYMREDSTNKEYAPNQDNLRGLYKIGDFISQSTIEQYKPKYGEMLTLMILDMNYQDVFEDRFASNEADFDKAVRRSSHSKEQNILIGNLNNLVGKEIYVGTKDKDGFHDDELAGEILSINPTQDGYSMRAEIEGKEYFINLTPNFEISNELSKFHEILIVDGDKFMKLQDVMWGKDIKYDNIDDAVNGSSNGIQDLYMTDDEKKETNQARKENTEEPKSSMNIWAGKNGRENEDLSNTAYRPFKIQLFEGEPTINFDSVELGFLYTKFRLLSQFLGFEPTKKFLLSNEKLTGEDYKDNTTRWVLRGVKAAVLKSGNTGGVIMKVDSNYEEEKNLIESQISKILNAKNGFDAKNLGGKHGGYVISGNSGNTFLDTIWDYGEMVSEDVMEKLIKASFEQNPTALLRLLSTGDILFTHNQDTTKWKEAFPEILMKVRSELRTELNTNVEEDPTTLTEEEKREAEKYKKRCEGE